MPLLSPYQNIAHRLEPIRRNTFSVSFDGPNGLLPEDARFALQSINPPAAVMRAETIAAFNSQLFVPGIKSPAGEVALSCIFFYGHGIFEWWMDWFKIVYDPETDRVGLLNEVVGQGAITLHTPDGERTRQQIYLRDCWPGSVQMSSLDMNSNGEPAQFEVRLNVTDVSHEF